MSVDVKHYREVLEKLWDSQGDCGSCGWHGCIYEHDIEDWEFEHAIEKNDGVLELSCVSKDDEDSGSHRGVKIYLLERGQPSNKERK